MDPMTSGVASSGSLRTKISIKGGYSQLSLVCPFHLMKPELPQHGVLLGSNDLLAEYDMSSAYHRFCGTKRLREDLGSFLPHLVGGCNFDNCSEFSSLKMLVEKPPITGKEIAGLSASAMTGFRLTPGAVPEPYRYFDKKMDDGNSDVAYDDTIDDMKQKRKYKWSLDELDDADADRRLKKHKNEDKERKKEKKKKKDKKRKRDGKDDEPSKRIKKM